MTSDSPELYVPALNAILKVVYPIVIAWISSRIIENQAVKRFRSSADGDALLKQVEQTKEIIRDFIDILAVNFLLVLLFTEALLLKPIPVEQAYILILLGILMPFLVGVIALLYYNFLRPKYKKEIIWLPFMVATFGGGNRGTALVIVLVSVSLTFDQDLETVLTYFVPIDLGNFIFLMLVVRFVMGWYIRRQTGLPNDSQTPGIVTPEAYYLARGALMPPIAIAIVVITSVSFKLFDISAPIWMVDTFSETKAIRSGIFMYLVFLSIFLSIKRGSIEWGLLGRVVRLAFISRLIGIFCVGLMAALIISSKSALVLGSAQLDPRLIWLCLGIFFILPPSSIFSSMLRTQVPHQVVGDLHNRLVWLSMWPYFGILVLAVLFSVARG